MFSQLRQRKGSTDSASRTRTQQNKVRDFWEIELEEASSSLFGSLHDMPLSSDESPSESQTESTAGTLSSSSSAIPATDPVDEAFLDYLEEIMEKDADEMLLLQSDPQMSTLPSINSKTATVESASAFPPRQQRRRGSLPRNTRKGKNPNKIVAGRPTLVTKPLAKPSLHRRSHSCDDALLLHLPRVYSALGVC